MEWYYILGAVSYGIFIIQFILSNIGLIDLDLDIDFDSDADFSVGDLVSFKGLTHFCMGFSGWLMINRTDDSIQVCIAIIMGLCFIFALAGVYYLCYKLKYEPFQESGSELIGKPVAIYAHLKGNLYVCYLNNPTYIELRCISAEQLNAGDIRVIKSYQNGLYYI